MKTIYIERNKLFKGIPMVLCNNITNADEDFTMDNADLFQYECSECKDKTDEEKENCDECGGNSYHESEAYQYFIVDVNEREIKRLKSYGVELGYSKVLELYILPIFDFGTSWSAFSYSKEVEDNYELSFDETLTRQTVY